MIYIYIISTAFVYPLLVVRVGDFKYIRCFGEMYRIGVALSLMFVPLVAYLVFLHGAI
jgi:hypothetical protein